MSKRLPTLVILVAATAAVVAVASNESRATTPGANGLIAYSKGVRGDYQLFTIRPDGTRETPIVRVNESDATEPDWSHNGRKIVFQLDPHDRRGCHVVLMNPDGSGRVDLTGKRHGCEGQPAFTADGRRIVFGRYDDKIEVECLWSMSLTGGHRRPITPCKGFGPTDPNVSPDGMWVTYVHIKEDPARTYRCAGCGTALFAVRPDGSKLHQLAPHSWGVALKHDWSPDGKLIVLTRDAHHTPGRSANVVTIRPDGSGPTQLTHFTGGTTNAYAGSFLPDGKQVVFRLERNGRYGLAVMDRDGRNLRLVTRLSATAKLRFIDWGTHP